MGMKQKIINCASRPVFLYLYIYQILLYFIICKPFCRFLFQIKKQTSTQSCGRFTEKGKTDFYFRLSFLLLIRFHMFWCNHSNTSLPRSTCLYFFFFSLLIYYTGLLSCRFYHFTRFSILLLKLETCKLKHLGI